jgi:hypothetical protein
MVFGILSMLIASLLISIYAQTFLYKNYYLEDKLDASPAESEKNTDGKDSSLVENSSDLTKIERSEQPNKSFLATVLLSFMRTLDQRFSVVAEGNRSTEAIETTKA